MKTAKTILETLITLCVCTGLMIAPMTLKTEAETEPASPCAGVGRIARIEEETTNYTPETETAEIEPYIAPETVVETETEFVEDIYVPDYVEVIPEADPIIETDIDALIVQVASEYGLPWELVRAVCFVESGFDANAISSTGDYGLMQVSYINHGWLGLENPLDPYENLCAGCTILKAALDNSGGDITKALMRYNRGDAYAMSQWSQGIFSTAYTEKVLEQYYAYERGEY